LTPWRAAFLQLHLRHEFLDGTPNGGIDKLNAERQIAAQIVQWCDTFRDVVDTSVHEHFVALHWRLGWKGFVFYFGKAGAVRSPFSHWVSHD
jgi:hypothetical protein